MNKRVCIPNIDIRRKEHFRNFFKNSKGFYDSNRIVYIYRVRLFDVKLEISSKKEKEFRGENLRQFAVRHASMNHG